ncbi:MAG: cobalt-precorrin-6A reductase [Rhodospirillaceae bacterium]|nr:cobalt-precorrin-6A reductase [Rhodospirillaceae bacterium]
MADPVLILGGTADARALAAAILDRWPDRRVITSLAGRTASPLKPSGEVVSGGFGGAEGLADFLRVEGIGALIDATHPFAEVISNAAVDAAASAAIPRLHMTRPPWVFAQNDAVQHVCSINAAKSALKAGAQRIFLAIGRKEVNEFSELGNIAAGRFFLLRFIDLPQNPPDFADFEVLPGRPGGYDAERSILQQFAIDTVVAKNGGSDLSRAKIDAALDLGLRVILIDPPSPPPPPHADSVAAAVDWLAGL